MKRFLFIMTAVFFSATMYASFPVNKKNIEKETIELKSETTTINNDDIHVDFGANVTIDSEEAISPAVASTDDTFIITVLLWLFLGGIAAHRWYKGKPTIYNILFILTLGGLGIWWLIDGINILTDKF